MSRSSDARLPDPDVHGLIFVSFRDYLVAEHGPATEAHIMAGEGRYFVSEGYPDERFTGLVERACRSTGMPHDELLREFGAFTAEKTFARLYPALFDLSGTARSFLLTVESRIHQVVRVAMPDALPPELDVAELGDDGVAIVYTSPRRLCSMLRGLVEGTARRYGEAAHIDEPRCMLRGDGQCTLEVRFSQA
jgi:predicted hydrocarbon binding protein